MIEARGLTKQFIRTQKKGKKEEFYAVDHVSFEAKDGEILGILGPNGAGKTTLLRMLGSLMEPTDGAVMITDKNGEQITKKEDLKMRIGYLSENTKLYGRFTVREMLTIFGELYGYNKEEIEEKIQVISDLLQMDEFIENRIDKLSTGQKQRTSIARCLVHNPDIYIFDEPTLGLDIISSKAIIDFMKQERERGKTVLYSTHYMEEAEFMCDRIVMINKGKIIASGTPQELREDTNTSNLRDTFFAYIEGGAKDEL
ncbi:MAG: ATP-binding cassette domain-containing protein [Lachnospiraceae bacterium]|nr:ATP-binding cassette domain-containing protein [Lachnospiraceae bacterium]